MSNSQEYFKNLALNADNKFGADSWASDGYEWGANGDAIRPAQMSGTQFQTSQPLIFTLSNTTTSTITSVSFLNAWQSIGASNDGVTANVTCTYGISGVTYANFLQQLLSGYFLIKKIYINCTTNAQAEATLTFTYRDAQGNSNSSTLFPKIDPSQNQNGIINMECDFVVDQYLQITLASLVPSATSNYNITMYPVSKAAPGLAQSYNAPRIGLVQRVVNV